MATRPTITTGDPARPPGGRKRPGIAQERRTDSEAPIAPADRPAASGRGGERAGPLPLAIPLGVRRRAFGPPQLILAFSAIDCLTTPILQKSLSHDIMYFCMQA